MISDYRIYLLYTVKSRHVVFGYFLYIVYFKVSGHRLSHYGPLGLFRGITEKGVKITCYMIT
jgi:hypothetical protein